MYKIGDRVKLEFDTYSPFSYMSRLNSEEGSIVEHKSGYLYVVKMDVDDSLWQIYDKDFVLVEDPKDVIIIKLKEKNIKLKEYINSLYGTLKGDSVTFKVITSDKESVCKAICEVFNLNKEYVLDLIKWELGITVEYETFEILKKVYKRRYSNEKVFFDVTKPINLESTHENH
jgi:hypothetical protein